MDFKFYCVGYLNSFNDWFGKVFKCLLGGKNGIIFKIKYLVFIIVVFYIIIVYIISIICCLFLCDICCVIEKLYDEYSFFDSCGCILYNSFFFVNLF